MTRLLPRTVLRSSAGPAGAPVMVGFSTGTVRHTAPLPEALQIFARAGCKAVELGLAAFDQSTALAAEHLAAYEYVSIHAPKVAYGYNDETLAVFQRIAHINTLRRLDLAVFHPDVIQDFSVFQTLDIPFAFENMDHQKSSHQHPAELADALSRAPAAGLVLDVNHIFTNDQSMRQAHEYYQTLGDRIIQVHASGYGTNIHEPLFKTKQPAILNAIEILSVPIILEGVLNPNEVQSEYAYVRDVLQRRP